MESRRWGGHALALVAGLACGVSRPWTQVPEPVDGLPDRFVADTSGTARATVAPAVGCRTRLVDPTTGTGLLLVRSAASGTTYQGDYAVTPPERYGMGPDRLLRVDCGTGRPLGTVPRRA